MKATHILIDLIEVTHEYHVPFTSILNSLEAGVDSQPHRCTTVTTLMTVYQHGNKRIENGMKRT